MIRVILPGSYDPITLGHVDIIRRAAQRYESVYVVAFINPEKEYLFSPADRLHMLRLATEEMENVTVDFSEGRVVDYMREKGISKIIKGYRNETDLEYERRQAEYNFLHGGYETELIKSSDEYIEVSSTLAREKIKAGDTLLQVLPEKVITFITDKH